MSSDVHLVRRFALQAPLSAAANRIFNAADEGEALGYAGITLDVEGGQVNVYWHGTAPAAVSSTVTAMRESVRVSLHAARPWQPRCNRLAGAVITPSVRTPLERALTDHD